MANDSTQHEPKVNDGKAGSSITRSFKGKRMTAGGKAQYSEEADTPFGGATMADHYATVAELKALGCNPTKPPAELEITVRVVRA